MKEESLLTVGDNGKKCKIAEVVRISENNNNNNNRELLYEQVYYVL